MRTKFVNIEKHIFVDKSVTFRDVTELELQKLIANTYETTKLHVKNPIKTDVITF